MSIPVTMIFTGLIVIGGRWAEGEVLNVKVIIGVAFAVFFLSLVSQADKTLAQRLALLVLIVAFLRYTAPLLKGLDLI